MRLDPAVETALEVVLVVFAAAVAIVALRWAAAIGARQILRHEADGDDLSAAEREKRVRTIQHLFARVATVAIVLLTVLTLLSQLGIDIGPAVAGLGVAGLALGLGAQALVRDWLAGVFILAENQFSRGDHIDVAGVSGTVEELGLRRTVLRGIDGTVHTVPNGQITVASNRTRLWAGVDVDVQVAHGTDLDAASALLDRVGAELATDPEWRGRVLEPPAVERVDEIRGEGVTLKILGRVRAGEQWRVTGELRRRILLAFAGADGEPGYPLRMSPRDGGGPAPGDREQDATVSGDAGRPASGDRHEG